MKNWQEPPVSTDQEVMGKNFVPMRKSDDQLLKALCEPMTKPGRQAAKYIFKAKKTTDLEGKWIGSHLLDYATTVKNSDHNIQKKLREDKLNTGFTLTKVQCIESARATGIDSSKKVFEWLAEGQSMPLVVCLVEFLEHCETNNWTLIKFNENIKDRKFDHENPKYSKVELKETISEIRNYIEQELKNDSNTFDPFEKEIVRLTENYYPRHHISQEIFSFLKKENSGFITIYGDAGAGKSAILANTVQTITDEEDFDCIWYFTRFGSWSNNSYSFFTQLYKQLVQTGYDLSSLESDFESLDTSSRYKYAGLFQDVLRSVSQQITKEKRRPLVIIIDALDEISNNDPIKVTGEGNLFAIPKDLPVNIFFILSARNNSQQNFSLQPKKLSLDKHEKHQINDIRGYVTHQYSSNQEAKEWAIKNELNEGEFVDLFSEKSEYRFIYLHHVFADIKGFDIANLPHGIEQYYEMQYERLAIKNYKEKLIVAGIANFQPNISIDRLCIFSEIKKRPKIHDLVKYWIDIKLVDAIEDNEIFYCFSHLSFYEYLEEHSDLIGSRVYKNGYERLSDTLSESLILSEDSGSISYCQEGFQREMKQETLRILLDSLLKIGNVESAKRAAQYLTSRAFCTEYLNLFANSDEKLLHYLENFFNIHLKNKTADLGNAMLKNFILKIEAAQSDSPVIRSETVETYIRYERGTPFAKSYLSNKEVVLFESSNELEHKGTGNDKTIDQLRALSLDQLTSYPNMMVRKYRDRGYFDKAIEELNKCKIVFIEKRGNDNIRFSNIALIISEIGNIELMRGRYEEANVHFTESHNYLKRAKDKVGIIICKHFMDILQRFDGSISSEIFFARELKHLSDLAQFQANGIEPDRCEKWQFPIQKWLFYFAVELDNQEEAEIRYELFYDHPHTVSRLKKEPLPDLFLVLHYTLGALLSYVKREYEEALALFAKVLSIDLSEWGHRDERLSITAEDEIDIAREYLYAGRALLALKRIEKAKYVFNAGLACTSVHNHYYKEKIRKELAEL